MLLLWQASCRGASGTSNPECPAAARTGAQCSKESQGRGLGCQVDIALTRLKMAMNGDAAPHSSSTMHLVLHDGRRPLFFKLTFIRWTFLNPALKPRDDAMTRSYSCKLWHTLPQLSAPNPRPYDPLLNANVVGRTHSCPNTFPDLCDYPGQFLRTYHFRIHNRA